GLGGDAPPRGSCAGGRCGCDEEQRSPDARTATFGFPTGPGGAAGCTLVWEHRVWEKKGPEDLSYGVSVHGDKGTLIFKGDGWEVRGGDGVKEPAGKDIVGAHVRNFLDCVRDGKTPN